MPFVRGKVAILVATSVLEVGVDVPSANCMVIEQAERFGLSSLHQLRGRVGRGPAQAYAFLIYGNRLTESGIQRLKVIKTENDGFRIAEQDLKIRGPGEFLGTRQAGVLKLGLADLLRDQDQFLQIRHEVERIVKDDPNLLDLRNRAYRGFLEARDNQSPLEDTL